MLGEIRLRKVSSRSGLSLLEILLTVATVGVLATITAVGLGNLHKSAGAIKVESDLKTMNRAVASYIGANGKLSDCNDVEEVLTRLKTAADPASSKRLLGFTGSAVDPRIRPLYYEEGVVEDGMPRIRWNAAKTRFEISNEGPGRIRGFVADDSAVPSKEATDERSGIVDLAQESAWIWDYVEVAPESPISALEIPTHRATDNAPSPYPPAPPVKGPGPLDPPIFSIPSTNRPIIEFDLRLGLSNPNPSGSSSVYFSKDYGAWAAYDGQTIPVAPDTVIQAQSISIDPTRYSNSGLAQAQYKASPVQLESPVISTSLDRFDPARGTESTISMLNPNDENCSHVEYRLNGGGWNSYSSKFPATMSSYPAGVDIEAKAVGISKYFLESEIVLANIGAMPGELDPPIIDFSHEAFDTDKQNPVTQISVVLHNPNPSDISAIHYRIVPVPGGAGNETEFKNYSGPFSVPRFLYPDGFGIRVYTKSLDSNSPDSEEASRYASSLQGVFGGHLDLDTSDFLAEIGSGGTSAHTHDLTGKYDLTSIDFFAIPDEKQLEINEAVTNPSQGFKLSVINANLSPGMRIVITRQIAGRSETVSLPVAEYDNSSVNDLPVYSFNGRSGTAKLTGLNLQFDKDVIQTASVIPTNTGDVKKNVPGKNGEWRNGSFTIQAVAINRDGTSGFSVDPAMSAGDHGAATSGLLWEATLFWHWKGASYHESTNDYVPGEYSTVGSGAEK